VLSETPSSHPALDEVMARYAGGEDAAFGEVFRRGAPRVRGFLLRLCLDRAQAEDLTQETFLRVHLARGSFERGAPALPWLLTIAKNAFFDAARRTKVRRNAVAEKSLAYGRDPASLSATQGDEMLAAREMAEVVSATLDRMAVTQREAFVLIRFQGMTIAEAAQVLGASEAAVKVRAFRAYEQLRQALGPDGGERPRAN
jgi:RNA polymerase sigma-70 factor (ECF subfamily)